ncbi:cupin [Citricoccus alkalitolerans]|uniref:Cupin n=1 Tax=Citricoccus alkalitolerans TaxID=246603 RepID=A0ABV8XZT3_9MICC
MPTPQTPRRLVNTEDLAARAALAARETATSTDAADATVAGAIWKLEDPVRELDSNIISLPAGDGIDAHQGPDNDVMIHVLHGSGTLGTAEGDLALRPGDLLWMPRRSMRRFTAGASGLIYHTVHVRKPGLLPTLRQ